MTAADSLSPDIEWFRNRWGLPDAAIPILEKYLEAERDGSTAMELPAKTARIFMMREWLELETEEICKELTITTSNAWVLLYRARMRLRECLDLNWFGKDYGTT